MTAFYQHSISKLIALYQHTISTLTALYQHTINALSVHYQYTISTLTALYQYTISTLTAHYQYTIVHWQHTISTLTALYQHTISTLTALYQRTISTLSVHHHSSITLDAHGRRKKTGKKFSVGENFREDGLGVLVGLFYWHVNGKLGVLSWRRAVCYSLHWWALLKTVMILWMYEAGNFAIVRSTVLYWREQLRPWQCG